MVRAYASLVVRGRLWDGRGVPSPAGRYGPPDGPALPLVILGDSSAVTVGVRERDETNGARLAGDLVAHLGCAVELAVPARAGVTTAGMARQVREVVLRPDRGVAVVLVGGNDVMLPAGLRRPAAHLGRYVRQLRTAGWQVVVGSCADIGAAPALRRGVRRLASARSRVLARRQAAAALSAGAVVVSLTTDAFRQRPELLYCADGFHPNADGYLLYQRRAAVAVRAAAGLVPVGTPPAAGEPADGMFTDPHRASRHVTREPGACFIPAQCTGRVLMRRYVPVPQQDQGTSSSALTPTAT
ncbi:GDSL-type esterase/lipase family protein [Streptomyces sp. NPDC093595]|uniref:GDSL-type esterase/lipase family protein n=1 Tax=Streptomyces sp. NPDC093595 TaxID=3366045 RepID=UPI003821C903